MGEAQVLYVAGVIIMALIGVVWTLLNNRVDDNKSSIKSVEERLNSKLSEAKEAALEASNKLERRYDREMSQLADRLSDQVERSEMKITTHLGMLVELIKELRTNKP